jgi:hypothetical protein
LSKLKGVVNIGSGAAVANGGMAAGVGGVAVRGIVKDDVSVATTPSTSPGSGAVAKDNGVAEGGISIKFGRGRKTNELSVLPT